MCRMETRVTSFGEHVGKSALNRVQENHPYKDKKWVEKNSDKALAVIDEVI